jgi:hypothetical protein
MGERFPRFMPHAVLATIVALSASASLLAARALPLPDGADDYNAPAFVINHAWTKFAYLAGDPLRDDLSTEDEDARVARFFELNDLIAFNDRVAADPLTSPALAAEARDRAAAYRDERRGIENSVERIIEGRLTAAIKDAGLTRHVVEDVVWPPVDIEFEEPPSVLVKSPRAEIRRESETLLASELPAARVRDIEARAEADGSTSALVVRIGAIATYPAIIPASPDYHATLETAAHEWLHHYLFFAPLGRRYYEGGDLTTLNETVANMGGRELACFIDPCDAAVSVERAGAAPSTLQQQFDFTTEMRELRRSVETMLAAGDIEGAERLMEDMRLVFVANGYYVRRINQAYFAFHGSYADTAGSIDPIGPKLERLRSESATFEEFVETTREFTSEADLDTALRD